MSRPRQGYYADQICTGSFPPRQAKPAPSRPVTALCWKGPRSLSFFLKFPFAEINSPQPTPAVLGLLLPLRPAPLTQPLSGPHTTPARHRPRYRRGAEVRRGVPVPPPAPPQPRSSSRARAQPATQSRRCCRGAELRAGGLFPLPEAYSSRTGAARVPERL